MSISHRHISARHRLSAAIVGGVLMAACGPRAATPPSAGEVAIAALPPDAPVLAAVVVPDGLLVGAEPVVAEGSLRGPGHVGDAGRIGADARAPGDVPAGELPGRLLPASDRPASDRPAGEQAIRATFAGGAGAADLVASNRVLVIGDSIAASTSDRYSGETCAALASAGWLAEIDAEAGRHVDFGVTVVDERLPEAEFDAAVVMLGSNYRGKPEAYEADLRHIVDALAPRPTLLMTVTEFRDDRADVNAAIREVAAEYENVRIIDWASVTAGDSDLLAGDGLHLNPAGRARFADLIVAGLGAWHGGGDSGCVPSRYTDDLS